MQPEPFNAKISDFAPKGTIVLISLKYIPGIGWVSETTREIINIKEPDANPS
jgi:hypothetical protein